MGKQFTASEVREYAKYDDSPEREMLNSFADLLEARERAVPVMVVNHVSSAEHDLPIGMKLYAHPDPSDAQRLAEALRNLVSEWVAIADDGDATLEDSTLGYRACANRLSATLTAHSAQAHPPAASVPEALRLLQSVLCDTDGNCCIRGTYEDRRTVDKALAMLAAQENPNG
jgi:hypothetical protein